MSIVCVSVCVCVGQSALSYVSWERTFIVFGAYCRARGSPLTDFLFFIFRKQNRFHEEHFFSDTFAFLIFSVMIQNLSKRKRQYKQNKKKNYEKNVQRSFFLAERMFPVFSLKQSFSRFSRSFSQKSFLKRFFFLCVRGESTSELTAIIFFSDSVFIV